jgi:hypothetical protein
MSNGPSHGPGGTRLSRPRPRLRPGAWDALCASGPRAVFSYSGQIAAWRVGHTVRERAVGRFLFLGRISIVNNNLSQFIFCSEIV